MKPRHLAYALIIAALALLFWPRDSSDASDISAENGVKAARSAIYHRQMAAEAVTQLVAARLQTERALVRAVARVDSAGARAVRFDGPVVLDSTPRIVVGGPVPGDTLVPLRLARERIDMVVTEARFAIASLDEAMQVERARADSAIGHLQRAVAAQDTVIASLRRPWYKRAVSGVEHAGTGAACAAAGFILGGPWAVPVSITSGVVCAAISGVKR
jgi:hypothetical protein